MQRLKLNYISDRELKRYESVLTRFFENVSYQLKDYRIIIYINKLKEEFAQKTVRNHLICIRKFLRFIKHPIAEHIQLPKLPKRRKIVIKTERIAELLRNVEELTEKYRLRLRAAILLSATSGLRAEELYRLRYKDIDLDNRIVYIRAEIAKDFEDRVTFFSLEAQRTLQEYISSVGGSYHLFSKKSINYHLQKLNSPLRMKHMRKFFSQQSDRLGMPTAVKKILMGHSLRGDVDLSYYDFQDEEELKKIYDKYWRDFRIEGSPR